MTNASAKIGGYMAVLDDDAEEARFLRSVPWILDVHDQSPDMLIKALRCETSRFKELPRQPTFSLLTVLRDTTPRHLGELILSARCQSYQDWQLILVDDGSTSLEHLDIARSWASRDERVLLKCVEASLGPSRAKNQAVEQATGEFLIVIDGDGVLHPRALGVFARHVNDDPKVNFLFSNEAEIDSRSSELTNFLLKPPLDLFTLLRINYIGRLYTVRRSLLDTAAQDGEVFRHQYDGLEEHDLLLRLALSGAVESRHAQFFLYYRRARTAGLTRLASRELSEKRRLMLAEGVPKAYPGMTWTAQLTEDSDPLAPSRIWLTDLPGRQAPKLLIVVPFKDQVETTIQCLESIEKQEHRLDVVVALVNNCSIEPDTLPRLRSWTEMPRTARYEVLDHDGAFNFATFNNKAVSRLGTDCDLVLMLNNGVELATNSCLQTMAMLLVADKSAGFVGIKLYYPGGKEVQHGGIRLGAYLCGSGINEIVHARSAGEFVDADRISLGVTFACAMTRRETFERLGGLEEFFFPNGYSEVHACLKALEAGYRNYYLGSLYGIHHEGKSRGFTNEDLESSTLFERHGPTIASWRLRHLHLSYRRAWPLVVLPWNHSPPLLDENLEASEFGTQRSLRRSDLGLSPRLPLRYRLADRVVATLERGLGPLYATLRSGLSRAGSIYRVFRRPGAIYALIRKTIKPIPILGPASGSAVRGLRRFRARWARVAILMDHVLRHPAAVTSLAIAYRDQGYRGFRDELASQLPAFRGLSAQEWFRRTRLTENQLARLRAQEWTAEAPQISIIMPVYNVREFWLRQAISSVIAQTYPHWELICANDASPAAHVRPVLDEMAARDSRVVVIHCAKNRGVSAATNIGLEAAKGDYVFFMDHDDFLEPHALQRCAEAILENRPDMIYSDQAFTGEDIDEIAFVSAVPAFSYDYYLSHPYFVHPIAARTEVVRQVGGLDETMNISHDVDFNLRLIEVCRTICHIPEVLYRWRLHAASLGHQKIDHCRTMTRGALERHFARTGQVVLFDDESYFNFRDLRFQHETRARVAILIPTTHGSERLRACIRSLERTVDRALADVIVLDNRSEEDGWTDRLAGSGQRHRLVSCRGLDSIPAIINRGVDSVRGPYTHYLILSQDAEAIDPGWLEHMLGYGQRTDVGVVGALLIDRSERVQHAGLFIGFNGLVDSVYKDRSYRGWLSGREPGQDGSLLASRDVSAVSSSCLLTKADLFHPLGGMDEQLAVALFDVDYCLRASTLGYKTIQDAHAILFYSQFETHDADLASRRAEDVRRFRDRYSELIRQGDRFYSPLLSRSTASFPFDDLARPDRIHPPRTTRVVLPTSMSRRNIRFDKPQADRPVPRPNQPGLPDPSQSETLA